MEAGLPAEGTAVAEVAADHLLRELLPHIRSKNQIAGHRPQVTGVKGLVVRSS